MKALNVFRVLAIGVGLFPWILALSPRAEVLFGPAFRSLCHQRPERTLSILGASMVVCSRCAGLYAGVALGALLPLPARWLEHARKLVVAAFALTVFDVVTQDLGLHSPLHSTRLATGLLLGWTATAFFVASIRRDARSQTRSAEPHRSLAR